MDNVVVGLNGKSRQWLRNKEFSPQWLIFNDQEMHRFDAPQATPLGTCCPLTNHDLELCCYKTSDGDILHEHPQRIIICGDEKLIFLTLRNINGKTIAGCLWEDGEINRLLALWPTRH